jgi:hypothetical protein
VTSPWATWNPAAWFVGLYRWIAGDPRPVMAILAARAAAAAGLAVAIAVVAYPLAYDRCLEQAIAAEGARAGRWAGLPGRLWLRLMRPALPSPLARGLAAFVVATLTRSPAHRFVIGSYLALAVVTALPAFGRLSGPIADAATRHAWFAVPLGLLGWSATGLRVAMMLPSEPAANWLFRLTEPVDKARVLTTTASVIAGATALPLSLGFGATAAIAGGAAFGATVGAVVLVAGALLVELLTLRLRAVPCTCTYRPGQLRLRVLWPVYLFAWIALSDLLPRVAVWAGSRPWTVATLLLALAGAAAGLRRWRRAKARRLQEFVYDEVEPPATTTIALGPASA